MRPKISVIVAVLVCLGMVLPCFAQKGQSKLDAEVKALLEQHDKALNAQDLKGIMNTYASDPNIVLMGTGPGEAYVGEEAIGSAYNQFFTRFKANALHFKYDWISVGSKDNVAWFAVTVTVQATVDKKQRERAFNISGTMEKTKGNWRFLAMHFSRLGAGDQAAPQPK